MSQENVGIVCRCYEALDRREATSAPVDENEHPLTVEFAALVRLRAQILPCA
jgi:hypothetical protein